MIETSVKKGLIFIVPLKLFIRTGHGSIHEEINFLIFHFLMTSNNLSGLVVFPAMQSNDQYLLNSLGTLLFAQYEAN